MEVLCEKGVFKNFAVFTEKTPVLDSLFNKVAGSKVYLKEAPTQVFPVNIAKFLRTPILKHTVHGCFC